MAKATKKSKKVAVRKASPKKATLKKKPTTKASPKKVASKKAAPAKKKVAAKKASPKKSPPKKAAAKKAASKTARPKKAVAKKAAPKKVAPKKAAAKQAAPSRQPVAKRSLLPKRPPVGAPEAADRSRGPSSRRRGEARAFLPDPAYTGHRRVRDDLAEELGEEYVSAATSGESVDDARDEASPEEEGGPFITTSAVSQYGRGTDESNPEDAEREAFPTTRGGHG